MSAVVLFRICTVQIQPRKYVYIMQIIRLPPGHVSYIIPMKDISALKDPDHAAGTDVLSEVCYHWYTAAKVLLL